MTEKKSFVDIELLILEKKFPESHILLFKNHILKLYEKFSESGQSGGSAPYTAYAITNSIKKNVENNILIELNKNPESLDFEFIDEINLLSDKIKEKMTQGYEINLDELLLNIRKLCLYEPIAPITGSDEEWGDVRDFGNGIPWFQNLRCSALFKDEKNGKPYYIDAIIKRDQKGICWSGMAWLSEQDYKSGDRNKMIGKKGYVKSFPFTPKTFYIDVKDVEVEKDDWESFIVDPSQLNEVWNYYDKE